MLDFFIQGGPLFMGLLTIILVAMLFFGFRALTSDKHIKNMKSLGMLALVVGILGQLIGLFSGFATMEALDGGMSPSILAGGLKVSMITTIYGLIIFLSSLILTFILNIRSNN
jgi:biopolymer transport protein ExbB/TolQ